ncbi:putative Ig domain-containing protein [Amaricoccus sp. B4]|uniref:putative Ig domain-containing protein n=1 Tax=Amaricoccus sp. B4 TaxID=3368557 RepID=UPI00371BAF44
MTTVNVRVDNEFTLYVNGTQVLSGTNWAQLYSADLDLAAGDVLALHGIDTGGAAEAFVDIQLDDGQRYGTGTDWRVSTSLPEGSWMQAGFDDSGWASATSYGAVDSNRLTGTGDAMPTGASAEWIWSGDTYRDNEVFLRWTVPSSAPAQPQSNTAPVVSAPIDDQLVPVGQSFAITVPSGTFTDADGDALTLSAARGNGLPLPSWLSFDAATGTLSGTPSNLGALYIRVTADDGHGGTVYDTFHLESQTAVNTAPVVSSAIADQTATANQGFTFVLPNGTFTDADGDALTLSATLSSGASLPSWLSFDAASRTFSGTPTNSGALTIRVTANDGHGGTVNDDFDLSVQTAQSNTAPVVSAPIDDQLVPVGQSFAITVPSGTFTDADGDALTLSAARGNGLPLPSWLSFDAATGTLSGTPSNLGALYIRVTADDGHGGTVYDTFHLESQTAVNTAPVVSSAIADQTATANQGFTFVLPNGTFTDADGDALTLSATLSSGASLPSWLSFDAASRTFSGTPTNSGALTIRVTANDGHGGTVNDDFDLSVQTAQSNTAPVVSAPIDDQLVPVGQSFAITVPSGTFTDADGDALTLSAARGNGLPLPSWLSFDAATGTLSGTPSNLGALYIRVTADDGHGGTVYDIFHLESQTAVNTAPVVSSAIADQTATANQGFTFVLPNGTFTDADGDALTLSATLSSGASLPSWLSFDAASRTFSGTPTNSGALTIRVTANDGHGGTVNDDFDLSVQTAQSNTAPVVSAPIDDQLVPVGQSFAITVPSGTFTDADGDALTLSAARGNGLPLPSWLSFDAATGTLSGTPSNLGALYIRVTADDGHGGTVYDIFHLESQTEPSGSLSFAGQSTAKVVNLAAGQWADAARIMPLGDSITQGYDTKGGYRLPLWQSLVDNHGLWVDFVGAYTSNSAPSLLDINHQGYVGITAQTVLSNIDSIATANPHDIALLLLGTNEVLHQSNSESTVPGRLLGIMRALEAHNPDVKIFLGTLLDIDNASDQAKVDAINAQLPSIVATAKGEGIDVTLVDNSNITTADLYDDIHPTPAGAAKLADNWYQAMLTGSSENGSTLDGVVHTVSNVHTVTGSSTGDMILGSQQADTISGGAGNDRLEGQGGNDSISGGDGNDFIIGGLGNDTLTGGAGADFFVFDASHAGMNTVTDLYANDTLLLTGFDYATASDAAADLVASGSNVIFSNGDLSVTFLSRGLDVVADAIQLGTSTEHDLLV